MLKKCQSYGITINFNSNLLKGVGGYIIALTYHEIGLFLQSWFLATLDNQSSLTWNSESICKS